MIGFYDGDWQTSKYMKNPLHSAQRSLLTHFGIQIITLEVIVNTMITSMINDYYIRLCPNIQYI